MGMEMKVISDHLTCFLCWLDRRASIMQLFNCASTEYTVGSKRGELSPTFQVVTAVFQVSMLHLEDLHRPRHLSDSTCHAQPDRQRSKWTGNLF